MIASIPENRTSQSLWRFVLFAVAALCAWFLEFRSVSAPDTLVAKIGFSALLLGISVQDFRTRTVSPAITLPWMTIGLFRALVLKDVSFLPYWLCIFWLWTMHLYGGGDAKLLMGLTGLWPDTRLVWITSAVLLVVGLPMLVCKYWGTPVQNLLGGLSKRFASGALFPNDDELNQGIPFAFAYCLAGAIYIWAVQ